MYNDPNYWSWSLHQEDPLEEGMETHSSFLAWRIPGTEEAGVLQSIGSQSQTWLKQLSVHTIHIITLHSCLQVWYFSFIVTLSSHSFFLLILWCPPNLTLVFLLWKWKSLGYVWFCDPVSCSPWDSPDNNSRVVCHFALQGIFLTQGSNPPLRADS